MQHRTATTRTRRATRAALGAAVLAPLAASGVAGAMGTDPGSGAAPAPADDGTPVRAGEAQPPTTPGVSQPAGPVADDMQAASDAFWGAGYALCDGEAVAAAMGVELWDAKLAVGRSLLAGEPVAPPSGCVDEGVDTDLIAFWDAGYLYCDAAAIGAATGVEPFDVKLAYGRRLAAGEPVEVAPSGCDG